MSKNMRIGVRILELTFTGKRAIFSLAGGTESIRSLTGNEVLVLREIYNSCSEDEKIELENEAACVVEYLFRD